MTTELNKRFCRFCQCERALSCFPRSQKAKRRVCLDHIRTVYRLKHTVGHGGSIAVEHFRRLKNAYQVFARDARKWFGGLKPQLRIQDLAVFIPADDSKGQWCVPVDPLKAISADNVRVLTDLEQRKTLLQLWQCTHDAALYAQALAKF